MLGYRMAEESHVSIVFKVGAHTLPGCGNILHFKHATNVRLLKRHHYKQVLIAILAQLQPNA
jgi:hypothetical protein